MKIVGLTGAAGSGKDTVCEFALAWCEANGIVAERVAFADPLKVSAARALGLTDATTEECVNFCNRIKQPNVTVRVEEYIPPNTGPEAIPPEYVPLAEITGRQYLQFYGTEAHRDVFGQTFWQDVMKATLAEKEAEGVEVVFIPDTRFENEGRFVNERGEIWRVQRPDAAAVDAHSSEVGLPDGFIEFDINNTGSLNDLRSLVRSVCEHNLEEVQ